MSARLQAENQWIGLRISKIVCLILSLIASASALAQSQRGRTSLQTKASTSADASLTSEARQLAQQFWTKYLIKCGASYFLYSGDSLLELRDSPHFSFSGKALSPKILSRAEILNGVDPLPVEYEGAFAVSFNLYRMNTSYYGYGQTFWHGWRGWSDSGYSLTIGIKKVKGNWQLSQRPKAINCDSLKKWGFVIIPEGLRGAEAEARAERDAKTQAMILDAPNLGIHVSQNPPYPIEYLRSLYMLANRIGSYKVKFFPNGYFAVWGVTSYHKFPDSMETAFQKSVTRVSPTLYEAEIAPGDKWVVIASRSLVRGDYYVYAANNIPQSMIDAFEELKRESDPYYAPNMDKAHSPRWIVFGPNNTWVMLYGEKGWKCDCSPSLRSSLKRASEYGPLKQVAFDPNGGFLILSGMNYFAADKTTPKDLLDKMLELIENKQRIDQVFFMPNGSWALAGRWSRGDWGSERIDNE